MKILLAVLLTISVFATNAQWSNPDAQGRTYYNNGNVGIGTNLPTRKFQIQDSYSQKISLGNFVDGPGVFLSTWMGSGSNYQSNILHSLYNTYGYGLAFSTVFTHSDDNFTSYATRMYLAQSGQLGIGTINPGSKLTLAQGTGTPRVGSFGLQLYNGTVTADSKKLDGRDAVIRCWQS